MMCTEPVPRTRVPSEDPEKQHSHSRDSVPPREPALDDIENAYALKEISESNTIPEEFPFKNLTFAHIVNQIWHFSSVDHGPRCKFQYLQVLPQAKDSVDTCIGYNTLFVGPNVPKAELDNGETLPEGQRIWTWLILTDDGRNQCTGIRAQSADCCRNCDFNPGEPIPQTAWSINRWPAENPGHRAEEFSEYLLGCLQAACKCVRE